MIPCARERVVTLRDYTPTAGALPGHGAGDLAHGEAGDDSIHGAGGRDILYGEGQDDDLHGESDGDWLSGGTGHDGVLGDDGLIRTSRNGTAEPLHGVVAITEQLIQTSEGTIEMLVNPTGKLAKSVELLPFETGANDTMYGGLGDDSVHGGAGVDGLSGAEALPGYYEDPTPFLDPASPVAQSLRFDDVSGNLVAFSDATPLAEIEGHALNFEAFTTDESGQQVKVDDGAAHAVKPRELWSIR